MIVRFRWKIGFNLPEVWVEHPQPEAGVWIEQNHAADYLGPPTVYDYDDPDLAAAIGRLSGPVSWQDPETGGVSHYYPAAPQREPEGQEAHLLDVFHRLPDDEHYGCDHTPLQDDACPREDEAAEELNVRLNEAARRARQILRMPGRQCSSGCCPDEPTEDTSAEALHRQQYQEHGYGDMWKRSETSAHYGCIHDTYYDDDGWFYYTPGG